MSSTLVKRCPACGRANDQLADFCSFCPTPLDRVPATPTAAGGQPQAASGRPVPAGAPTVRLAEASLTCADGTPLRFVLADGAILGRGADLDVTSHPSSRFVSRRHVRFTFLSGTWQVEDLRSTSGSSVDGVRLVPGTPIALSDGGRLTIANVTFAVRIAP